MRAPLPPLLAARLLAAPLLAAPLLAGLSFAQTVTFELSGSGGPASASILFENVPVEDVRVGLGLRVGSVSALRLDLRETRSFGPVGNLLLEGRFDLRTDARYRLEVSGRGVIGSVAARASLAAANGPPALFSPFDRFRVSTPSAFGDAASTRLRAAVGLGFRASRNLLVEANPTLHLVDSRLGGGATVALRRRRLSGDDDGELSATAVLDPAGGGGHVAVGATYVLNRRREPSWRFGLSLGAGSRGFGPGVSLSGEEPVANGGSVFAELAAEPFRVDVDPYRMLAGIRLPFQGGDLTLRAGLAFPRPPEGTGARVGIAWSAPFRP